MEIEKFYEYYNNTKNYTETKIDYIESLLDKSYRGYKFKFASKSVFCFGKEESSILIFDEDSYLDIQGKMGKKAKNIGGYNIYEIDKNLKNPFFNNNNQYLESHFYFRDSDYFKKIKYFMSKILTLSEELNHYPSINWDSNRIVEIKIYTHDTGFLSDKDFLLADKISQIWYNIS
jgi:pterin-4a-carbinolamine dehydratase